MKENGELILLKSNKFVQEYRVRLSQREQLIVNYLIANIKSPKYDTEFREFDFDIKEFCKIVYPNQKIGDIYNWLPQTIKALADKSAWKEVPDEAHPGKNKLVLIRWIEEPEFSNGRIKLKLNRHLAPHLLQLDSSFFQSKFKYTIESTSKYTIPLYELLKSWEKVKNGIKVFDVDELRIYLDASAKSLSRYADFKRNVLVVAVEQINAITDIHVEFKEIKRGRSVEKIEFHITQKNTKAKNETKKPEKEDIIDEGPALTTMAEEFPEFTHKQHIALYYESIKHIDLMDVPFYMHENAVVDYISPKLMKIKATPEETKTTVFKRLLNAVENDY